MDAVDYILDGLEAELELERELGLRVVECDRALLAPPARPSAGGGGSGAAGAVGEPGGSGTRGTSVPAARAAGTGGSAGVRTVNPAPPRTTFDFIFLHDKPLSAKGIEMMAKIIGAMHATVETAPVIVAPPRPKARISIVLGGLALRKWFPGVGAAPGQWVRTGTGEDILVTYSPEYILRFGAVTPAVEKIKREMWTSLKGVMQRLA